MNILFLANELRYTCGVTNHLLYLSRGLSEIEGNKIWILCGGGNGIERFNNINVKVSVDKRFLHEGRNIGAYMKAIAVLAAFIVKNNIDIVHSHSHYTANIAKSAGRFTGAVTVQTNHGLLLNKGLLKHFNAQFYVAINKHIIDYMVKNKTAAKSQITFIRCGIPVPASITIKDSSKLKIIAASRFSYEKGLDIYIKAVSGLNSETRSKADFYCAGEGELKRDLLRMNKESGANIAFVGSVKDMYKLLRSFHVLVYPSRSPSEGFPAIITEAGANGLVVISSNFPGAESVLKNNHDGLIFQMESEKELSRKMSVVINNFKKFESYGTNLYRKTKGLFSISEMIDKHQRLYEQCLK